MWKWCYLPSLVLFYTAGNEVFTPENEVFTAEKVFPILLFGLLSVVLNVVISWQNYLSYVYRSVFNMYCRSI